VYEIKLCTFFVILRQFTYKCFRLLSDYRSFIMFLHNRVIHTSPAVPKYNKHYFTDQMWPPLMKLTYTCLKSPVLGQWLKFSQCLCLFYRLFSQFCTYTIFLLVIKIYSNINLHMRREPTKYIFYEVVFLELLSTLDLCLKLSCVHFFVILRQLTYKCFRLLSDYRSFVMFLHNRVIHTSPVVPKCNEHYFTDQKWLPLIKLTYTCLERPVLGQWLNFSQCLWVFYRLFSQFCTYTIFWLVIKMYSNTTLHMHREPTKYIFFMKLYFWNYSAHLICVWN